MTMEEKAREFQTAKRQDAEHEKDSMLSRSAEEVETPSSDGVEQAARESVTDQRQQDKQQQESMLKRSSEEVGTQDVKES